MKTVAMVMKAERPPISYTHMESPLGELLLTSTGGKLTGLYFTDRPRGPRIGPGWVERREDPLFLQTRRQLEEYASGEREQFDLPIKLIGTPFQVRVWQEINTIPFGQTVTYGEIARRVDCPGGVRVTGSTAGRNPLCWIVPCHRVIAWNGSLTGYAGGIQRKQVLLAFESARAAGQSGHSLRLDFHPLAPFLTPA